MPETAILCECANPACTLGNRGAPGHFTGGITAEQVNLLTGTPVELLEEGTDFGEGICPNCGTKATEIGTHEVSEHAGTDVRTDEYV